MITSRASGKVVDAALAMVSACSAAAVGFDLCARRTQDARIAVATRSAAVYLHSLVESTIIAAAARGIDARPRARTCDRLRWEWLASTAMVVDGTPDARLLSECARLLAEVDISYAADLGDPVTARFRVASAEAYSLAAATEHMRRGQLALALT